METQETGHVCDAFHVDHFDFEGPWGIQIKILSPGLRKLVLMKVKDIVKIQMSSPSIVYPKGSFPSLNSLSLLVPHN